VYLIRAECSLGFTKLPNRRARQAMVDLRAVAEAARNAAPHQRQVFAEMRAAIAEYERMQQEYETLLRSQSGPD
jgi:hypothetical protein